jgi:ATPase family associated with various cellular activities (AAA)
MKSAAEQLTKAIQGRHSIVFVRTWEEERAVRLLESVAQKLYGGGAVWSWSCVSGLRTPDGATVAGSTEPLVAIREFLAAATADPPQRGFALFRDLPTFFSRPEVARAMREANMALSGRDSFLFLIAPELELPGALAKEVFLIDLELPTEQEMLNRIREVGALFPDVKLEPALATDVAVALRGLTLEEASHILQRIYRGKKTERDDVLGEVFTEKESIVKKSGLLEFVPPRQRIEDIGGLDVLKDWLQHRKRLFTLQAVADKMPTPRGILIMGMSGCGKSMCAKAASALWGVPLFRLDMNLVASGLFGTPEAAFHRALRAIEGLAPAILWIDEIENSLGYSEGATGGAGANSSVFSAFLTWMQEKPPLIFVAATANRIQDLPAEVIRKGRFDQVFFVDLPGDDERKEIFDIHLRRNGVDPEKFDTKLISLSTRGWNGAEIEQAVLAARVEAYHDGREMNRDDLSHSLALIVPLSKTMEEQMKRIRSWAYGRATTATTTERKPGGL